MEEERAKQFKALPSVQRFLDSVPGQGLCAKHGDSLVKFELRLLLTEFRSAISLGSVSSIPDTEQFANLLKERLLRRSDLQRKRAINASGVLLHTGLGRAPLCDSAREIISQPGFSLVQFELGSGGRSLREAAIEQMLADLTGCESATVLNNCAAATFMLLRVLAKGKEAIVSRGHLIEIGGSFRMPDVMDSSGAILREVGTTNKTHLRDYENAIGENTGAIVYVHPSNFKIRGFTSTPSLDDLAKLAKKHDIPLLADIGCGSLGSLAEYGLKDVDTLNDAIKSGASISCASGDKLIGGPQSGIILGTKELVKKVRSDPFARMFRVDKLTLFALEATLLHFLDGSYKQEIPLYRMLGASMLDLRTRAEGLLNELDTLSDFTFSIIDDEAYIGGGSLPDESIPSMSLRMSYRSAEKRNEIAEKISRNLRRGIPCVVSRLKDESIVFDMRAVDDSEIAVLGSAIRKAVESL
jgi:L-seryl-tRNA(Ser) seleniumtransferase